MDIMYSIYIETTHHMDIMYFIYIVSFACEYPLSSSCLHIGASVILYENEILSY